MELGRGGIGPSSEMGILINGKWLAAATAEQNRRRRCPLAGVRGWLVSLFACLRGGIGRWLAIFGPNRS